MLAEAALIGLHQAHLPDSGGGLQIVYQCRTNFPAKALHTFGDRAGRYQYHFVAICIERGDLARPVA